MKARFAPDLFGVSHERVPAELAEAMQRLVLNVEVGRCPADDFADWVIEHGIAAMVSRLALGES